MNVKNVKIYRKFQTSFRSDSLLKTDKYVVKTLFENWYDFKNTWMFQ